MTSRALAALRDGGPVLLRHDGGDEMVVAADRVTPRAMAFVVRATSGIVCVACAGERLDALRIPPMAAGGDDRVDFGVSVDLRAGISTGISARDRALTARALADPATVPSDLTRPGHVLPVRVRPGGVLERAAPAEAAADLCRLAGVAPAAVLATVVDEAAVAGLPVVALADVVAGREAAEPPVRRGATAALPTRHGRFAATGYAGRDGAEHLALVRGDVAGPGPVPVAVHVECPVGDVFGSLSCSCAADLAASLAAIDRAGRGALVYLRRGLRPVGDLGCSARTPRDDRTAAHILRDLGVRAAAPVTPAVATA